MKRTLISIGFGLLLSLVHGLPAIAVDPFPNTDSKIRWSEITNDPFDGPTVFDRNYSNSCDTCDGFEFRSSWSKTGIRATYIEFTRKIDGYTTTWQTRTYSDRKGQRREDRYPETKPVYRQERNERSPKSIQFAINDQRFNYESGPVSPELATALANAPQKTMRIRLVWADGKTTDMKIGKDTVTAWKKIF